MIDYVLVTAAFVVAALLCAYFVVTDRLGLSDDAQALVIQTSGLAAFAGVTSIQRITLRV